MMRRHFRDLHPLDFVVVKKEGKYPGCPRCGMQVDPGYAAHIKMKEYQAGTARCAIAALPSSGFALYHHGNIHHVPNSRRSISPLVH
jgi:hypothetical protein